MPNDLETSLKTAAERIVQYIDNVATLTVETRYVTISPDGTTDFTQAKPAARTEIKFDGDSSSVVPLHQGQTGLEPDSALFEIHMRNVTTAIEYRARILGALLNALQTRLK